MPKTRLQKEATVTQLSDDLTRMKGLVFADFQGLNAAELEELRTKCIKAGMRYTVAKKTLLKLALKNAGLDIDPKAVSGSMATVLNFEDEVTAAKTMADFAKAHEALKLLGGVLESKLVDAKTVTALSKLPSKVELIAKALGSIKAPISGFVNVLSGNLRGLVQVLAQIEKAKA
ncbi:MAG: 50S ribosomal protein L10 [bacterium]